MRRALEAGRSLVVRAPPGAGKSTRLPLALRDARWLGDARIVMLEPRRIAARAVATYMAELLGESVGATVGYRMRLERRVSAATRIEVVTEGILTRQIQHDPTLAGVGLVIFDEFHERSLDADLALALTLHTQSLVRDDLRVMAMSATLDGTAVARILGDASSPAPIVASEGRSFPVEVRYAPPRSGVRVEAAVAAAVRSALDAHDGDLLAFLPGAGEIARAAGALGDLRQRDVDVVPLYGMLDAAAQRRAILPSGPGRRKVVLATSIAETSLTIEGVRVVVDAGLARRPRFSPRTGMTRLETVPVSRAAAEQRRGRAGRVAPGVCYRLWSEHEQHALLSQAPAEISNADLAPLALDLAAAGVDDPSSLRWMDEPPAAAMAQARELLRELGALDEASRVTPHGLALARLPVHPRLANMLLRAGPSAARAAALAALLGGRDPFRPGEGSGSSGRGQAPGEGSGSSGRGQAPLRDAAGLFADADLAWRVDALLRRDASGAAEALWDRAAVNEARRESERLVRMVSDQNCMAGDASVGALLALAYPDRVAQRRDAASGRYLLRNGRGTVLDKSQPLARAEYLVVADVDDRGAEGRIRLAAQVTEAELRALFAEQIESAVEVDWDDAADKAEAVTRERLGALILREARAAIADESVLRATALATVRRRGLDILPWTERARSLRRRIAFARTIRPDEAWPDMADEALMASLTHWLEPHIPVSHGRAALDSIDVAQALEALLSWQQRRELDALAPERMVVPTGSALLVDYSNPAAPTLAVRIQELFGLADTPRVGGGAVALTLELLSPARRPVQVTRDLAGFWRNSYFDVRKDLRGRYPKHDWPEDPLAAGPTRRAKPR